MLVKKNKLNIKLVVIIFFALFFVLFFIFKNKNILLVSNLYQKFFLNNLETDLAITQSEKEQLISLEIENKLLKSELKNVKDQINLLEVEESKNFVQMLGKDSEIYGDFYVTFPKGKTIYKGMNIFTGVNIVVGQVAEIYGESSLKINRLGQIKNFIAESLENEESIDLQSLSGGLYFGNVSSNSKISLGDTIVLKGYPKAIVGTVVEIAKNESALSSVFVRTPYNIQNKEVFYVLQ